MEASDVALAKRFGVEIRRRRNALAWSQAMLAERIETSVEYVSMLERGTRLPSVPMLVAITAALGLSADDLLGTGGASSTPSGRSEDVLVRLVREVPREARAVVAKMLAALVGPGPVLDRRHEPPRAAYAETSGSSVGRTKAKRRARR